ncbi:hypothetical protein GOL30_15490 [Sinorhizobium medicae]|uniref:hypothetical protein n=1 Tax=Sinorhizobium medicae TaxID=110321 RepID=UPI000310D5D8|nr:hypothetical protein [Sinorhizobium medicae]MDX0430794.1 hypothetical protein [Sinorhizobium medicae]MDX0475106.1 hypothetical protein [Sinorhizobium medicae]MDX0524874.1 hypothetical protein [Sinorhizobium medicae]MDX0536727.1 hypothetical protein [Sinorhizobium medicae]
MLPITAIAGETRDLARGHGANPSKADFRHHPVKSRAGHAAERDYAGAAQGV